MKKMITHCELRERMLKDPAFLAVYEAESDSPEANYQIVRPY